MINERPPITVEDTKDYPKTVTALKRKKEKEFDNIDVANIQFINWIYILANKTPPFKYTLNDNSQYMKEEDTTLELAYLHNIQKMMDWLYIEYKTLLVAINQCYGAIEFLTLKVGVMTSLEKSLRLVPTLPQELMQYSILAPGLAGKDVTREFISSSVENQDRAINSLRHILTYNYVINRIAHVTSISAIKKLETESTSFYTDLVKEYNEKIQEFFDVMDNKNPIDYNYPVQDKETKKDLFNAVFQPIDIKVPKRYIDDLIADYSLFYEWRVSNFYDKNTETATRD